MLTVYESAGGKLMRQAEVPAKSENALWFDLLNPTADEDRQVEQVLGISVPTRDEMREIEASNRFYTESGATYITSFIVHNGHSGPPESATVTFILSGNRLVTVRYTEPRLFPEFLNRVERGDAPAGSAAAILVGFFESIIQNKADLIERVQDEVDKLAQGIFDMKAAGNRNKRLDALLKVIGQEGDIVARVQESATSIDRGLHFFEKAALDMVADTKTVSRIQSAERDNASLAEHLRSLSNRVSFLLDATLGMIATEQNQIIKLFSVMAVMLMPPTLVASIYGMNFRHMPEIEWEWGYPLALGLMFLAAVIPFVYFKRKGWL
ncbi:MAG: magnesium transporter CorA family protein [Hyphomicrobium sp.]